MSDKLSSLSDFSEIDLDKPFKLKSPIDAKGVSEAVIANATSKKSLPRDVKIETSEESTYIRYDYKAIFEKQ